MGDVALEDLCLLIVDSEHKTAPKDPDGLHPLIRTTDLGRARADLTGAQRVNSEVHSLWTKRAVPTVDDLILAREAPVGGIFRIPNGEEPVLGQRTVLLRPDPSVVDSRFLMYRLASDDLQARMTEMSTGSTVPHLNMADIRAFPIPRIPPLSAQRRIAAVLSAFDTLIEINERRIGLLEDLARSLYREWFVHFRFQGHGTSRSVDSELSHIPDGWTSTVASRIFDFNPRVVGRAGSYPKVTMGDVSTRFSHVLPSANASRPSGVKFEHGDVLMARITPSLENGKTALVLFLEPKQVGIGSTELTVLRGSDVGPAFTYCAARSQPFRDHAIKSMSGASGRQRVANDCFDSLPVVRPAEEVAALFESVVMPMLEEVFQLRLQSDQLAATRDLLLPRLVTGQLDISDVDLGVLTPTDPE
jgi:type I restriction enzyme S subunit